MNTKVKSFFLVVLGSLSATLALAQSTTTSVQDTGAVNQSVTTAQPEEQKSGPKLPVRLNLLSWFYGPELANPTRNYIPGGVVGDQNSPDTQDVINSIHNFYVIRDLGNDQYIGAVLDLKLRHSDPFARGQDRFELRDCFVRYNKAGLLTVPVGKGGFSLDTNVRYYAPTSKRSWRSDVYGALRWSLNPNYQFSDSPFSITMVNYVKAWANSRATDPLNGSPLNRLELYTGPQFNAIINDRLTFYVLYEAVMTQNTAGNWSNEGQLANATTDVQPTLDVKIIDNLTISPFLNWYPSLPISTTSMNLNISASL